MNINFCHCDNTNVSSDTGQQIVGCFDFHLSYEKIQKIWGKEIKTFAYKCFTHDTVKYEVMRRIDGHFFIEIL